MHHINPTKLQESLAERVAAILEERDVTYASIARKMGRTPSHVSDVLKRSRITLRFLESFATAMGYTVTITIDRRTK